ncbi:MAG: hypothetical protein JO165_05130 [Candidatus Eremiobacteraeota bacterium]|nr:hypothetical protein [Candidatus Eremiobacteraeota bacterium]
MRAWKYGIVVLALVSAQLVLTHCRASGQPSGAEAMRKLAFLTGTWKCTFKDTAGNNVVQQANYSFSPDGLWMTETSHDEGSDTNWETQMWGYDVRADKLVAYQFYGDTVSTKSVQGWVDGVFVSRRDDNNAIVSMKPVNQNSMEWIIKLGKPGTFIEECSRK